LILGVFDIVYVLPESVAGSYCNESYANDSKNLRPESMNSSTATWMECIAVEIVKAADNGNPLT
jgi:hypothetical protein